MTELKSGRVWAGVVSESHRRSGGLPHGAVRAVLLGLLLLGASWVVTGPVSSSHQLADPKFYPVWNLPRPESQIWSSIHDIAVDSSGNMYAIGGGESFTKLDPFGGKVWDWLRPYGAKEVAVFESDGTTYLFLLTPPNCDPSFPVPVRFPSLVAGEPPGAIIRFTLSPTGEVDPASIVSFGPCYPRGASARPEDGGTVRPNALTLQDSSVAFGLSVGQDGNVYLGDRTRAVVRFDGLTGAGTGWFSPIPPVNTCRKADRPPFEEWCSAVTAVTATFTDLFVGLRSMSDPIGLARTDLTCAGTDACLWTVVATPPDYSEGFLDTVEDLVTDGTAVYATRHNRIERYPLPLAFPPQGVFGTTIASVLRSGLALGERSVNPGGGGENKGGLALNMATGTLLVADHHSFTAIREFTTAGAFVRALTQEVLGRGTFRMVETPQGVYASTMPVNPSAGAIVRRFDRDGHQLGYWTSGGGNTGSFLGPDQIAADASGTVYMDAHSGSTVDGDQLLLITPEGQSTRLGTPCFVAAGTVRSAFFGGPYGPCTGALGEFLSIRGVAFNPVDGMIYAYDRYSVNEPLTPSWRIVRCTPTAPTTCSLVLDMSALGDVDFAGGGAGAGALEFGFDGLLYLSQVHHVRVFDVSGALVSEVDQDTIAPGMQPLRDPTQYTGAKNLAFRREGPDPEDVVMYMATHVDLFNNVQIRRLRQGPTAGTWSPAGDATLCRAAPPADCPGIGNSGLLRIQEIVDDIDFGEDGDLFVTWDGHLTRFTAVPIAPPPACPSPPANLVGFWPADGHGFDLVGGNHGTVGNGAAYEPGMVDLGLSFDGVDDRFIAFGSSSGVLDLSGTSFTVDAWVKPLSLSQPRNAHNLMVIVDKAFDANGATGYFMGLYGGTPSFGAYTTGGGLLLAAPNPLTVNVFAHLAATYDGAALRLYANGVLVASGPLAGNLLHNADDFAIGNDNTGSPAYGMNGIIDEVGVYDRALSPSEMQGLFTDGGRTRCRNSPPSISLFVATPATEGSQVSFTVEAIDLDGDSVTYMFDFDDDGVFDLTTSSNTATHVYGDNGVFEVRVRVSDPTTSQDALLSVPVANVPPVLTLTPAPLGIVEGDLTSLVASFNDPGSDDVRLSWFWQSGPVHVATFLNDGVHADPLDSPDGAFPFVGTDESTHTYVDNGLFVITVQACDDDGGCTESSATVEVANAPPLVTLTGPPAGSLFAVGTPIPLKGTFSDVGIEDTHVAAWTLTSSTSTVTMTGTVTEMGGSGTVDDATVLTVPGVYRITLTVVDDDGGVGTSNGFAEFEGFIVVYDPTAGFVTGGGWIPSPPGAYVQDLALTGKASFGFVSKYQKGATVPTGQTEFQFKVADLNFHSKAYEWLVVAGSRAQFKGYGTVNGAGDFGFLLTAIDGHLNGGGGTDAFRIKIWDRATGTVVYDNQLGADEFGDVATAIGGGSIVIHKG